MRIRRSLGLCLTLVLSLSALAAAQDTRTVGVTIAYPAAVGILWHASDTVAIRPDVSFSGSSSDATIGTTSFSSSAWNVGVGVSALFYLRKYDHLRTYFSPRYTYSRTSSTSTPANPTQGTLPDTTQTSTANGFAGSFGAQYGLSDRFSLFGELGFGFAHSTAKSDTGTQGSGNAWGLRSGVGVVLYF